MNEARDDAREFDAMPARSLKARWTLESTLTLATAAHFGGQGDSSLDMPVLRCGRTEQPLLPGTTLAGALRDYSLDRLAGYANESGGAAPEPSAWEEIDKNKLSVLFGAARGDDEGSQSPLIVFDALGSLPGDLPGTEVRDGVMIETATGTAADHKKFDYEVLPPGTMFALRFDVLVANDHDECLMLSLLCASLDGLGNGDIRIGMRRSRGLGELSCANWKARRFDLSMRQGWLEWIGSHHEHPAESVTNAASDARLAIERASDDRLSLVAAEAVVDKRKRVIIEADVNILGDVLIRSPNTQAAGPDVMHLASGGTPVISGASLTGVVRAQALRIAQLVRGVGRSQAENDWITPLFGPRYESTKSAALTMTASRLRISERPIANGHAQRVTRVAIDRFTQGTVPTALFEEQPHVGGAVSLRFEIRDAREGELGLLLLVLKDLLTGQLPVGGASSVGRGVLLGTRLRVEEHGGNAPCKIELTFDAVQVRAGQVPASDDLNTKVAAFVNAAPALNRQEERSS